MAETAPAELMAAGSLLRRMTCCSGDDLSVREYASTLQRLTVSIEKEPATHRLLTHVVRAIADDRNARRKAEEGVCSVLPCGHAWLVGDQVYIRMPPGSGTSSVFAWGEILIHIYSGTAFAKEDEDALLERAERWRDPFTMHACSFFVDRAHKTIEFFDPNGRAFFQAESDSLMAHLVQHDAFAGFSIIEQPEQKGYQAAGDQPYCALYNALYAALRLDAPAVEPAAWQRWLFSLPQADARRLVTQFFCVFQEIASARRLPRALDGTGLSITKAIAIFNATSASAEHKQHLADLINDAGATVLGDIFDAQAAAHEAEAYAKAVFERALDESVIITI